MNVTKATGERSHIRIDVDERDAFAYDGNRKAEEVATSGEDNLGYGQVAPPTITYMYVEAEYRCNGIGLELIRSLFEQFGMLQPAQKNVGNGGINALTDEGERLIRRAQAKGFVVPFADECPQ